MPASSLHSALVVSRHRHARQLRHTRHLGCCAVCRLLGWELRPAAPCTERHCPGCQHDHTMVVSILVMAGLSQHMGTLPTTTVKVDVRVPAAQQYQWAGIKAAARGGYIHAMCQSRTASCKPSWQRHVYISIGCGVAMLHRPTQTHTTSQRHRTTP